MTKIEVYLSLWEYLWDHGHKTITIIDKENAWEYRVNPKEFTIKETFYHTVKAIYEDAGNWFLNDSIPFKSLKNPMEDLKRSIDRMMEAIRNFQDENLDDEHVFQWGQKTTIAGAIQQNLFHAVGHFSQLRNWVGICRRALGKKQTREIL
ncbi:MAG: hypothetical protein ACFFAE_11330 [Candidatus Hodarchaeota archaeon]